MKQVQTRQRLRRDDPAVALGQAAQTAPTPADHGFPGPVHVQRRLGEPRRAVTAVRRRARRKNPSVKVVGSDGVLV